jgi:hypothetical protein
MEFRNDIRKGAIMPCPSCGQSFKYTVLTIQNVPIPFFYSTAGGSILLRRSDESIVAEAFASRIPTTDELETLWCEILKRSPRPPEGGTFELWANVKCPNCNYEFPYNRGYKDINLRIFEPKIIVADGVILVGDTPAETCVMKVEVAENLA